MRFIFIAALALTACASDPVPRDAAEVDVGADLGAVEGGSDVSDVASDRPIVDAGQLDAGEDSAADVGLEAALIDDPAPDVADAPDASELVDVIDAGAREDALDAVAEADAVAEDAGDAGAMDVGGDAVAVGDEGVMDSGVDVVDVVDAAADRPDVVDVASDVPRDAGAADAGGVVYDLEAARTETSYRVTLRETLSNGSAEDCDAPPTATSCSVTSDTLRFSLHTCSTTFTGAMPVSTSAGRSLSIFSGGGGSFATTLRLTAGARVGGGPPRRSFHVQASAPVQNGEPAVSGIPGRTVDPALADIWLLGCPSD